MTIEYKYKIVKVPWMNGQTYISCFHLGDFNPQPVDACAARNYMPLK